MNTEIESIEKLNPVEIFQGDKLNGILKSIEKEIKAEVPDVSTVKGRDRIKSLAHKVARTKTTLDGMGKNLVSEWKAKSKLVDESRKSARDFLDSLKEDVRRPLTEWEQEETRRVERIEKQIEFIKSLSASMGIDSNWLSVADLKKNLSEVKSIAINKSFAEFSNQAAQEKDLSISKIEEAILKQEAREKEQAELERLRIEESERKQKERDEQIAKEAAEAAAIKEREKAAEEIRLAKQKEETAEREKKEAEQRLKDQEEKAAREKKEAVEAEQRRAREEKAREEQEKSRREADLKHRKGINNEALKGLEKGGLSKENAKLVVELIAKKLIPHITINY